MTMNHYVEQVAAVEDVPRSTRKRRFGRHRSQDAAIPALLGHTHGHQSLELLLHEDGVGGGPQ